MDTTREKEVELLELVMEQIRSHLDENHPSRFGLAVTLRTAASQLEQNRRALYGVGPEPPRQPDDGTN